MKERNAKELYLQICQSYDVPVRPEDFTMCISAINKKLKPLCMELRHGKAEDDGTSYFALINTFEGDHSQVATEFNPNEIAFFKKVLDLIVTSNDGFVSAMTLVNLGTEMEQKMTASVSEALLTKLVEEKWLTEIDGEFMLGPRSIIELSMYLKNIYQEEIPDCKFCSNIVVKGQTCANCGIRVHLYCANRCLKGRSADSRKCPGCQARWLHKIPEVAEQTEELEMADERPTQSTSRQQPSSSRRNRPSR